MKRFFQNQPATEVLVRDPAKRTYNPPEQAADYAPLHWEYAVMSSAAYEKARMRAQPARESDAKATSSTIHKLPGWTRWVDFPSEGLLKKLKSSGLYVDVWERQEQPKVIAVIFEGTNFTSVSDWRANLRWFLRFLPSFEDQYTIAADEVARELYERLATNPTRYVINIGSPLLLSPNNEAIKIVAS
ncbi:MAG: hypothetical protein IPL18_14805, partial [Sphingomonadales bacterium]|nr:hypothetical protein [Sphingomonadales bacterium]